MYTKASDTHWMPEISQKFLDKVKKDIENLDKCFSKSERTIDDTMVLYRGIKRNLFKNSKIGDSLVLKNYTSTSKDPIKAKFFVNDNGCCLYRLKIDKDIPYIDMSSISVSPEEEEVLLPRDLIMTYEKYTSINLPYPYGNKIIRDVIITRKKDDIKDEMEDLSMNSLVPEPQKESLVALPPAPPEESLDTLPPAPPEESLVVLSLASKTEDKTEGKSKIKKQTKKTRKGRNKKRKNTSKSSKKRSASKKN
jgi:hypothetical protein